MPSGSCVRKSNWTRTVTPISVLVYLIKDPIVGKVAGRGASIYNTYKILIHKAQFFFIYSSTELTCDFKYKSGYQVSLKK